MTKFLKKDQLSSNWYEIDAKNAVVGRLAAIVSKIIRGKNKTTFTPHMDDGDFVVVKNVEKIKFTGKKFQNKKYYRHTGYPGGIKETTPDKLRENNKSDDIIKKAIKGMLPNSPLFRDLMKNNIKLYRDANHPHESQNPKNLDFKSINRKNEVNVWSSL